MQDYFNIILKLLLLLEIIADYSELTSYKKQEETLHLYLKEIHSIPKVNRNSKLSSKEFFEEILFKISPSVGTKYIFTSPAEDGLKKILERSFLETEI